MSDQSQILLQTKLHRPRLPHNLVVRTRLLELLNQGIDRQLTLVCAPPGFGKTTLIVAWLEQMAAGQGEKVASIPSAWLSLDGNDNDLNIFLRYFIAALRTIFSDACEETLALLLAQMQPPQAVLFTTFSNELEVLPGEAILVLDDYHSISKVEVHDLLSELALHWPKPLHLVLISRIYPPISLANLRAKGLLTEIRTRDLRFTHEETAGYLNQSQFNPLIQNELPLLEEYLEGWPAGLHLVTIALGKISRPDTVLSVLSSESMDITKYLMDEVLIIQFPAIRLFLLKTSTLDRFCPSLCEAIIGEIDAAWNVRACLDWIERSELFLIPLDNSREWFRYHHLFQEYLQHRLSTEMTPDQVSNLHRLASVWFEEHSLVDEALHHALAANDLELAVRQMNAGLRDILNRQDRPTLERWLRIMPEEMIQREPRLLIIKAWTLVFLWQLDLNAKVLRQLEELLVVDGDASSQVDDLQILRGQILVMRAQLIYFTNQPKLVIDLCQQGLMLLPPSWTYVRGALMLYLGMSMQASGQGLEAERLLLEQYESYRDKSDAYALYLLFSLCFNYLKTGHLEQCRQTAQVMFKGAAHSGLSILKNWAEYFLGLVDYQWNKLDFAAQHFTEIVESRYTATIIVMRDAVAGLALIRQSQGESSEAWQLLESISKYDLELRGTEDERTRTLRAGLLLYQGDLEDAGRWADAISSLPTDLPLVWLVEPQMIRVRILAARGTEADLVLATQILDVLNDIADRTYNTNHKLEVKVLRALVLDALGSVSEANAELEQAIDLARQGGYIRVFVYMGKPMQKILYRLEKQDHSVGFIRSILAAFPKTEKSLARLDISKRHPTSGNLTLTEPLTPRELEVLNLLRGSMSIKGIALKLNISYGTAKGHSINLYAKLGVHRRWEAVARAEELDILHPR